MPNLRYVTAYRSTGYVLRRSRHTGGIYLLKGYMDVNLVEGLIIVQSKVGGEGGTSTQNAYPPLTGPCRWALKPPVFFFYSRGRWGRVGSDRCGVRGCSAQLRWLGQTAAVRHSSRSLCFGPPTVGSPVFPLLSFCHGSRCCRIIALFEGARRITAAQGVQIGFFVREFPSM